MNFVKFVAVLLFAQFMDSLPSWMGGPRPGLTCGECSQPLPARLMTVLAHECADSTVEDN